MMKARLIIVALSIWFETMQRVFRKAIDLSIRSFTQWILTYIIDLRSNTGLWSRNVKDNNQYNMITYNQVLKNFLPLQVS